MEFVELIRVPKVDNVIMRRPLNPPVEGTLCITGHHLILSSRKEDSEELWVGRHKVSRLPTIVGSIFPTIIG